MWHQNHIITGSISRWSLHKIYRIQHEIKCFETNKDVNLASLQIRNRLLRPDTIMFNRLIKDLQPKINRLSLLYDYDDEQYNALQQR